MRLIANDGHPNSHSDCSPHQVVIQLEPRSRRLEVHHDGVLRLSSVLPAAFVPQPTWQFALSGCVELPGGTLATQYEASNSSSSALEPPTTTPGSEPPSEPPTLPPTDLPPLAPPALPGGLPAYAAAEPAPSAIIAIDLVRLTTSSMFEVRRVPLRLSLNGESLSRSEVLFAYYVPPRVLALSPASGPALGGTLVAVEGLHLASGSDRRCRFGNATSVPASFVTSPAAEGAGVGELGMLRCRAPGLSSGTALLTEISLNGQQFTREATQFLPYGAPLISAVSPMIGPTAGGTLVAVHGSNFGDLGGYLGSNFGGGTAFRCRFGGTARVVLELPPSPPPVGGSVGGGGGGGGVIVNATYNPQLQTIECFSPPLQSEQLYPLSITANGQSYTELNLPAASFIARASPVVSRTYTTAAGPVASRASGPGRGGTVVLVNGTGFDLAGTSSASARCRFGATIVRAVVLDANLMRCDPSPDASLTGSSLSFGPADFSFGVLPSPMVRGGAAAARPFIWIPQLSAFAGGYLQLTSASAASHGSVCSRTPPSMTRADACHPLVTAVTRCSRRRPPPHRAPSWCDSPSGSAPPWASPSLMASSERPPRRRPSASGVAARACSCSGFPARAGSQSCTRTACKPRPPCPPISRTRNLLQSRSSRMRSMA